MIRVYGIGDKNTEITIIGAFIKIDSNTKTIELVLNQKEQTDIILDITEFIQRKEND